MSCIGLDRRMQIRTRRRRLPFRQTLIFICNTSFHFICEKHAARTKTLLEVVLALIFVRHTRFRLIWYGLERYACPKIAELKKKIIEKQQNQINKHRQLEEQLKERNGLYHHDAWILHDIMANNSFIYSQARNISNVKIVDKNLRKKRIFGWTNVRMSGRT